MLLFLKNVEKLSVYEWAHNSTDAAPRCLYEVRANLVHADQAQSLRFLVECRIMQ